MFRIKNPILLFVLIWLFVLYIYSKGYSLILTSLSTETFIYVLLVCLFFILSYYFTIAFFYKKTVIALNNVYYQNNKIHKRLYRVFLVWAILTLVEIQYFKGLPLLSIFGFGGNSSVYTEWGIPSLHGFLNSMIILLSNYFFYFFIKKREKKYLYFFLLCVCWPILLVTRQMLMSMIIQAVFIYILINNIKVKSILYYLLFTFLVVFIFGLVGDFRSGSSAFIELVQPSDDYPSWLPSGFLWVYVYMVSPLSNVNFNIHKYPNFNFDLTPLISPLFPSFIREKYFSLNNQFNFQLVNDSLNVSTMFPTYLASFGYFGSLIFYFIIGIFISIAFLKFNKNNANVFWVFFLAIVFHNLLFSVFVDFFFNLVFIFQILLHLFICYSLKISRDKN